MVKHHRYKCTINNLNYDQSNSISSAVSRKLQGVDIVVEICFSGVAGGSVDVCEGGRVS